VSSPIQPNPGVELSAPYPALAASFVTTEHMSLQSARAQTVAESTARANMFLAAVSAALVSLGLVATATRVGHTFLAFAFVVLPTLAFIGFATFNRSLQCGLEDYRYARRIARLRAYYFDSSPELTQYLASVPPGRRLEIIGLWRGRVQPIRTVAGMVAIVCAVIVGAIAGLAAASVFGQSFRVAFTSGVIVMVATLILVISVEKRAWKNIEHEDLGSGLQP
jgi:hypothetical protein